MENFINTFPLVSIHCYLQGLGLQSAVLDHRLLLSASHKYWLELDSSGTDGIWTQISGTKSGYTTIVLRSIDWSLIFFDEQDQHLGNLKNVFFKYLNFTLLFNNLHNMQICLSFHKRTQWAEKCKFDNEVNLIMAQNKFNNLQK